MGLLFDQPDSTGNEICSKRRIRGRSERYGHVGTKLEVIEEASNALSFSAASVGSARWYNWVTECQKRGSNSRTIPVKPSGGRALRDRSFKERLGLSLLPSDAIFSQYLLSLDSVARINETMSLYYMEVSGGTVGICARVLHNASPTRTATMKIEGEGKTNSKTIFHLVDPFGDAPKCRRALEWRRIWFHYDHKLKFRSRSAQLNRARARERV
jgi:hypothetical protein